jgi:hypothetical protein
MDSMLGKQTQSAAIYVRDRANQGSNLVAVIALLLATVGSPEGKACVASARLRDETQ